MDTNIVPFRSREPKIKYAPGVPPFNVHNSEHIKAWNALFDFIEANKRLLEVWPHETESV